MGAVSYTHLDVYKRQALCRPDADLQQTIAKADEALYFVKKNGKGYYKIHNN